MKAHAVVPVYVFALNNTCSCLLLVDSVRNAPTIGGRL